MELEALRSEQDKFSNTLDEIAKYIFTSKYARYNKLLKRRETWDEAVGRVEDMHLRKFSHLDSKHIDEIKWAFDLVRDKKALPSMRSMQFGGEAVEAHEVRLYNCSVRHIDSLRSFSESFYLLLCGTGVGFGLSEKFLNRLPDLVSASDKTGTVMTYVVEDSIEGWSDSIEALLNCFFKNTPYSGRKIVFDYSKIRPAGAEIKTGGGKAPGYEGLKASHIKVKELLDDIIENKKQTRLLSINAYDILMHISDAVLSGGIRRSACSVMFDKDDYRMLNAKTGNWFEENPQRARSNNSVILIRDQITKEEFESIALRTKEWGEPGYVFADHEETLFNPCQPAWAPILTPDGIKPLSEINEGDAIWSETGWVNVSKKWSTGTKKVYRYETTAGSFYGTENHRLISNGEKIEAKDCEDIDALKGPSNWLKTSDLDPADIMAGLLIGDGTPNHKTGKRTNLVIGENDQDYFDSEIAGLIGDKKSDFIYEVTHEHILKSDLPIMSERIVPNEYFYGDAKKVAGFLRGLYSANGSVLDKRIALKISSPRMREQVQFMLSSIGIGSYFTTNKAHSNDFSNGTYDVKESYDINITADRGLFFRGIGFIQKYKMDKLERQISLQKRPASPKRTFDIVSFDFISEEEVFDITVDNDPHTYWTGGLNVSNCFEISFLPVTDDGRCGVQMCNLTSVNGAKVESKDDFYDAVTAATIIGTLQASYTNFKYLNNTARELTEKEALLGVSITGLLQKPDILLDPITQQTAAAIAVEVNKRWASIIGINQAARVTCIKPEGSSSLAVGSMFSGIHAAHDKIMWRRVQANKLDNVYRHFKTHNPHLCEESVYSANNTDDVITFPIMLPEDSLTKGDLTALKHLEIIKSTQKNWVIPGSTAANTKPINHNVSSTVLVKENEWQEVFDYIFENKDYFTAVSLLAATGDKDYKQAPNEAVVTGEEALLFREQMYNFIPVDYSWMNEDTDNTNMMAEAVCAGPVGCEVR